MAGKKCKATTKSGKRCRLRADPSGYCHLHNPHMIKLTEVIDVVTRVCKAKSWNCSVDSVDTEKWRYALITVSRETRSDFITAEFDVSINQGVKISGSKTSFHGYGVSDLHDAIMRELGNLSWLESSNKEKAKSSEPLLHMERICSRFHLVARQLRTRYDERQTLHVGDEYDVQDLLHTLLTLYFDDIRPEEWTPSYAGGSSRMDFLLKKERIVIEVKKTRKGLGAKQVGEQLLVDIQKYKQHPDCKTLLCFVYDPEARISNPKGIEADLNKTRDDILVKVFIRPTGL